ncbi:MAG: flagellar biosynthesis protein FlhF [Oscillospiraceae bacterium]|nr:flagellar biosynthesis protein FlhF [Oscillospiraceae bacterium]
MQVKRYHAENMKQAKDAAIRELGEDAVMISQSKVRRKGLKNLFRKPVLEVQFAYDPAKTPSAKKLSLPYSSQSYTSPIDNAMYGGHLPPESYQSSGGGLLHLGGHGEKGHKGKNTAVSSAQFEQLDKRMNSFESMLTDFLDKFTYVKRDITYDYPEEVQKLLGKLVEAQVREELAHSIARQTEQMLKKQPGVNAAEIIEHFLLEQFGRSEPILHRKFTQSVILMLGPTGVGKTTTMVKLAADFSVKQKKNVGIINTDTYRIGAQEQLQTYADILGVPLEVVYDTHELESAMENLADRDLIFVDTAGKRPGDEQHKEDLLEIVRILRPEDVLLCLSATTSFSSIKEMVDTYGFIDKYRVLITKIDETKYRGSILNISWYTQKPLAYVTTGQKVPDDIEIADVEEIVKQIIKG